MDVFSVPAAAQRGSRLGTEPSPLRDAGGQDRAAALPAAVRERPDPAGSFAAASPPAVPAVPGVPAAPAPWSADPPRPARHHPGQRRRSPAAGATLRHAAGGHVSGPDVRAVQAALPDQQVLQRAGARPQGQHQQDHP